MQLWEYDNKLPFESDFSFLNNGATFPTKRARVKNAEYRFRKKEYTSRYGKDRYLICIIDNTEKEIPYKVLSLPYFKLLVNKLVDLMFNNEISIKTGVKVNDILLNNIVNKTGWIGSIRQAVKTSLIYGDSYIKTIKTGASVFNPKHAFCVVDKSNINDTKAYVLWEPLFNKNNKTEVPDYIRFEVHLKKFIYECVKIYAGGITAGGLVSGVDYNYNGRLIKASGNWYSTGIDDFMVQHLAVNKEIDTPYGESVFTDIQDIVFAVEHRISYENYALNSLANPLLIVGASSVEEDENGRYKLKVANGNMLVTEDRDAGSNPIIPQAFQQDYKLDSSEQLIDTLKSELYELSEMGKVFLTSEYGGNISEESITNLIKGAIDKSNRILNDVYYRIIDSLYVLARLNDIEVNKSDLTVNFNVGQTDSDKNIADVCKVLTDAKILSKKTLREKYFGYTYEQSVEEQKQIDAEDAATSLQDNKIVENSDKFVTVELEKDNK